MDKNNYTEFSFTAFRSEIRFHITAELSEPLFEQPCPVTQRFESQGRVTFELFLSSIDEGRISFVGNITFSGKNLSKLGLR